MSCFCFFSKGHRDRHESAVLGLIQDKLLEQAKKAGLDCHVDIQDERILRLLSLILRTHVAIDARQVAQAMLDENIFVLVKRHRSLQQQGEGLFLQYRTGASMQLEKMSSASYEFPLLQKELRAQLGRLERGVASFGSIGSPVLALKEREKESQFRILIEVESSTQDPFVWARF